MRLIPYALVLLLPINAAAQIISIPDEDLQGMLKAVRPSYVDTVAGTVDATAWNNDPPYAIIIYADSCQDGFLDMTGVEQLAATNVNFVSSGQLPTPTIAFTGAPIGGTGIYLISNVDAAMITGLLPLPAGITNLYCNGCGFTDIPSSTTALTNVSFLTSDLSAATFSNSSALLDLYIHTSTLPASLTLPPTLTDLSIILSNLATLPALPPALEDLTISGNLITELPPLPATLVSLRVADNEIDTLPALPAGLMTLNVETNPLDSLPALPAALYELTISYTGITEIPALPPDINRIEARWNPALTSLPALPEGLYVLDVRHNEISELPPLPVSLHHLYAMHMPELHCLPPLPQGLETLWLIGSGVGCLPNLPPGVDTTASQFWIDPIVCNVANTTCSLFSPVITGTVYHDLNSDGGQDIGELALPGRIIEAQPGDNLTASGADGYYALPIALGSYTVQGQTPLYHTVTSAPYAVSLTLPQQEAPLNDVGYFLTPNIQDLVLDMTSITNERPGFESHYQLSYRNVGTQVQDGSVSFTYDAAMSFVSSTPAPDAINGTTLTWNFSQLPMYASGAIHLTLSTLVITPIGTAITHTAVADPLATDQAPLDNTFTYTATVVGSFDPNDKQVEPVELTPAQIAAGDRVTYTIRFQNTGTFLAERVVITDTLSNDLQWNTIDVVAASHAHTWYITDGVLHVIFNNINLPDSTSDEANSHGFVKFSMRPVGSLLVGETVENIANIHFDFNAPVITNAAVFSVNNSTDVGGWNNGPVQLYPDPVTDVFTFVQGREGSGPLEVLDVMGRVVMRSATTGMRTTCDVSHLAPGLYRLRTTAVVVPFVKQ